MEPNEDEDEFMPGREIMSDAEAAGASKFPNYESYVDSAVGELRAAFLGAAHEVKGREAEADERLHEAVHSKLKFISHELNAFLESTIHVTAENAAEIRDKIQRANEEVISLLEAGRAATRADVGRALDVMRDQVGWRRLASPDTSN